MDRGTQHERAGTGHLTRRRFGAMVAATVSASFIPQSSWAAQGATPATSPVTSPVSPGSTPAGAGPQLTVSPTTVRLDEPFNVVLTGLTAGQTISVSAAFRDDRGQAWQATAAWEALGTELDLAAQAPRSGTFTVADPMALIWAAHGLIGYFPTLRGTESVAITATIDGRPLGRGTVQRGLGLADGQPTYIYSDASSGAMVANFYAPAPGSARPAPAVIVLGGSEGGLSLSCDLTAATLASRGYATLNLAYFGIGTLPPMLENIPLEYFGTAIEWLRQQPSVRKDRIGVIGYSRGGELALLLGASYPELTAVVSFSGSGYTVASPTAPGQPAWTWRGKPLPSLISPRENAAAFARAEIPVERTNGPILMVTGEGDKLWPSTWLTTAAWDRLQRTHHPWPDQFLRYPGAGHVIVPPYMPIMPLVTPEFGGDPLSNEIASVNSWQAVLHLLAERLHS